MMLKVDISLLRHNARLRAGLVAIIRTSWMEGDPKGSGNSVYNPIAQQLSAHNVTE